MSNNLYRLVVFDWEGTISDTLGPILNVVVEETKNLGLGVVDPYQARKYVDLGLVHALKKLVPHLSLSQHEQLLRTVHLVMASRPTEVCLIPGVQAFIEQLHAAKIDVAIATNKGQSPLIRALQSSGLDKLFRITRSAGQAPAKPCPQMLEEIMDEFGTKPSSTLMIGDTPTDMEMAKSIHVTAIGVDFYHQNETALKNAGAVAVFDDYQRLAHFLKLPDTGGMK